MGTDVMVNFKDLFKLLSFKELMRVQWLINWEVMRRAWWAYALIAAIAIGLILAEVISARRMKRDG